MIKLKSLLSFSFIILLFACNSSSEVEVKDTSGMHQATEDEVESLVEQFILAENGSTINIPAGFYELNTQLIISEVDSIIIKGAGMDKTIISFKNLKSGGEGIKITGNNIVLEGFSVYDAPGDGIKTLNCDGITFRKINATWTNGDKSQNGTYAIYPVQCKNVLVEESTASHSRDAGIYVGQSENIIVRNCIAFGNVAGIEIENSSNAEVYDNEVYDNAGGILVFNLPDLPIADGKRTKIYNNHIHDNNHENFATAGEGNNGNTVTMIPPGSGVIVLGGKEVEISNNKILRNKTIGIAIANYQITDFEFSTENGFSPFSKDISIKNNTYERSSSFPDVSKELGQLISVKNAHGIAKGQDIVYDGIWDETLTDDITTNPMNICIQEPKITELRFTRFWLMDGEDNIKSYKEYEPFVCEYTFDLKVNL